jgi:hypothetical protein
MRDDILKSNSRRSKSMVPNEMRIFDRACSPKFLAGEILGAMSFGNVVEQY